MRPAELIVIAIMLVSFMMGLYFYEQLPDKTASHWNTKGDVDGYMPRF